MSEYLAFANNRLVTTLVLIIFFITLHQEHIAYPRTRIHLVPKTNFLSRVLEFVTVSVLSLMLL